MSAVLERQAPERTGGLVLGWRALLRLARRDALRHKARTTLVVLLIAIPVAALFLGAVLLRTGDLTDHQRDLLRLGSTADAVLPDMAPGAFRGNADGPATYRVPDGWRTASITNDAYTRVKLGDAYRFVTVRSGDLGDPLVRGAYDVRRGRAPAADGEAAVSIEAARTFGVGVGDTIVVRRGAVSLRVVGTYERAAETREQSVLTYVPVVERPVGVVGDVWVDAPAGTTETQVRDTLSGAFANWVVTRTVDEPPAPTDRLLPVVVLYTIGTIGLFVVGIVVSAAFAVSARRQLRLLGLAGSNGADPRQLRLVVTAQGILTGLAGVLVAAVVSTGALVAVAPHLNRFLGFRAPGLRVLPVDVVLVAGLAVLTAAVAAYLPGRTASRVPMLAALAGRRPLQAVPAGVPLLGIALFGAGLLFLALSVSGGGSAFGSWFRLSGSTVLLLVGAVLATPWLMGRLEPLAGRLRGGGRLAARGMARHRARTGPICAAILAASGGAMAVATFASAEYRTAEDSANGAPRNEVRLFAYDIEQGVHATAPADVVASVRGIVGAATVTRTAYVTWPSADVRLEPAEGALDFSISTDAESLEATGAPAAAVAAFRAGRALSVGVPVDETGRVTVRSFRVGNNGRGPDVPIATTSVEAIAVDRLALLDRFTGGGPAHVLVVPASVLAAQGWTNQGETVVLTTAADLREGQIADLRALASRLEDETKARAAAGDADVRAVSFDFAGARPPAPDWLTVILGALVTAAALGVTAVGLALSATEARDDLTTLTALGAPPRLRRRVRAWEALLTAGIAGVLAVPLGFVPAAVAIRANRGESAGRDVIVFPWTMALVVAVAVPLVAAAVAYASGRSPRGAAVRND